MKRIFSIIIGGLALMTMFSCEEKIDNSEFSEWLGENYNQECLWNMDSIAFRRAEWQKTDLQKGASLNSATIKMLNSYQSVKYLTYGSDAFATSVGAPESGVQKISESVGAKTVFAMNGGPFTAAGASSYLKIDGNVKNNTDATTGLGFTVGSEGGIVSVVGNGSLSEYESAIGGGVILLVNGYEQEFASSEENDTRMARSIFGVTKDGRNVMAVIEGGVTGKAEGCTLAEAAFMARIIGMHNAVALASGDAATMWVETNGVVTTTPTGENAVGNYIYAEVLTLYDDGEDGSKERPYVIKNKRQLTNMHYVVEPEKELWFELAADIDLEGVNWEPLNYDQGFTRKIHFDGKGHTIKNFYSDFETYPSFFGVLYGECRNVKFENAEVTTGKTPGIIGGYVGTTGIPALLENCHIEGKVTQCTNTAVGGVCGNLREGTIRNCYVDIDVVSSFNGGVRNFGIATVAGEMLANSAIEYCFAAGKVDGLSVFNAGGMVGRANKAGVVTFRNNISWVSEVIGRTAAGSLVGRLNYSGANDQYTLGNDYSRSDAKVVTYANFNDFTEKPPYNNSAKDYAYFGTTTDNPIDAAKALKWDEAIWDLSGATPQLKLFKK